MLQFPPDSHCATASQLWPLATGVGWFWVGADLLGVGAGLLCVDAPEAGGADCRLCRSTTAARARSSWACMAPCLLCRSATCDTAADCREVADASVSSAACLS